LVSFGKCKVDKMIKRYNVIFCMALEHKINAGDDDYVSDCTK